MNTRVAVIGGGALGRHHARILAALPDVGLVGIGGYPQLIDGGAVTAPHFAFYTPEGKWEIENRGVSPDIEVEMDPKAWREGRDIQLEKAVSYLLDELKKNPPKPPQRPAYPNYHNGRTTAASGN